MIKPIVRFATLLVASLSASFAAEIFETLHEFTGLDGRYPETAMTVGPDGALYGTTSEGGANSNFSANNGAGVVFRYSPADGFSKVVDLHPDNVGYLPHARLLNIGDGNLYGACKAGSAAGVNTGGSVFRIAANGAISVVHAIPAIAGSPYRAVYLASGEPNVLHVLCEDNSGIRRVPLDGSPVTFPAPPAGTPKPQSFIRASDGFLYGATFTGGANQNGSLFRANADGSGYTVLHSCVYSTGIKPIGAMVQARDGNLYGLMSEGGIGNDQGLLYRLNLAGEYSVVHRFSDFDYTPCDLLLASDGMLYGIGTSVGPGGNGNGGVWRMKTDGTGYKVLHVFQTGTGVSYPTGRAPVAGLVQGPDGNIYGTTRQGPGTTGGGTIFRIKLNLPPPPMNRAPLAVNDVAVTTGEQVTVNVLANDFDADGDGVVVTIKTPPNYGTAEVQPNGTIVFTPDMNYAGADEFTYALNDLHGGKSSALVQVTDTAPPTLFQPGAYNGLVSADDDLDGEELQPRGQFQLTVKQTGAFTGTLVAQGKRIPLKGAFTDNRATAKVTLPDRKTADVFFVFQAGNPSTIVAGFFGTENWTAQAGPVRPSGELTKQRYTVQLPANPAIVNGPAGHGYGAVTVQPTGAVLVIGKLGDGSVLKWATSLTELPGATRVIPVYSEPLKLGSISGLLASSTNAGEDFVGSLAWTRPAGKSTQPFAAGFTGDVTATLGKFIPPGPTAPVLNVDSAAIRLIGPGFPAVNGQFAIEGKKIVPSGNLKAFTINRTTGIFSGTMKSETKNVSFKGAVNQAVNSGLGYFTIGLQTGKVDFIF